MEYRKVRDHCHYTGKYRGALHSYCNLRLKRTRTIPIAHNLTGYDSHLLVKRLADGPEDDVSCIPRNEEKYITFNKRVLVDTIVKMVKKKKKDKTEGHPEYAEYDEDTEGTEEWEEKKVNIYGNLKFIDWMNFMPTSLEKLVGNMERSDFKHTAKYFQGKKLDLMLQKGVYPYEYMTGVEKFREKELPPKEMFASLSSGILLDSDDGMIEPKHVFDENYCHAQEVFKENKCKNLGDFSGRYCTGDTLQLADVVEKFRDVCLEKYKLDPPHYINAPSLANDAMLKMTGIKLELLTDPDMYLFFEKGIRGGNSTVTNRYSKANNPDMGMIRGKTPKKIMEEIRMRTKVEEQFSIKAACKYFPDFSKEEIKDLKEKMRNGEIFNANEIVKYIQYLDANNLYGCAMSQPLPVGKFKWLSEDEIKYYMKNPSKIRSCTLEVDLEYPEELHDLHNDFSLAPEIVEVNDTKKLIAHLGNRKNYVLHHKALHCYSKYGMKLTKIHRGVKYEESTFLEEYIASNTKSRKAAKNEFEKEFYKLMNNSVFGKTMENVRERSNIKIVNGHNVKKLEKLIAKPNCKGPFVFEDSNLVSVNMRKSTVVLDKPIYLGQAILDISKTLMYDFHYGYIKPKYDDCVRLLFTDTDSLCYEIQTKDFYEDIAKDVPKLFDTSSYPEGHPIQSNENKKVLGMMKDEAAGKIIIEFVGLRSKLYAYKIYEYEGRCEKDFCDGSCDDKKCIGNGSKKCKGVKKPVVKDSITFENYKDCLFNNTTYQAKFNTLRSRKHEITTECVTKVALSANDDKRYIIPNDPEHRTLALGHYRINGL